MTFRWFPEALAEANGAAAYYQEKRPGLAQYFLDNLENALHRIRRHPFAYRCIEADIRKCRVARFPYGIIYRAHSDSIEIIAVMHLRRSPGYWSGRME